MDENQRETYRQLLLEMRSRLARSVENLQTDVQQSMVAPGRLSNQPTHPADSDSEGIDTYLEMAGAEDRILEQVDGALKRMDQDGFGLCERCAQPIEPDRLEVLPYTAYCVKCAHAAEKAANRRPR